MDGDPVRTDEPNLLLAAALAYAARGWRVVPLHECVPAAEPGAPMGCSCGKPACGSQGKHPRVNVWTKVASADAGTVRGWWKKWPGANVGVAPGAASGFVFIDVDTKAGQDLLKKMADGGTEDALLYRTGKGWRLMYAIPEELPAPPATRTVELNGTEAVRFQADGGQCVMPPSMHYSGKRYEWVSGRCPDALPLAPMPDWLIAEMCRPKEPVWAEQAAREIFSEGRDFNRDADWWRDVLCNKGFSEAGRSGDVFRYTRPGKPKGSGPSVTTGHWRCKDGSPALYVFSGSIPGLDAGKSYDKFGAFARLYHGGDFNAASAAVRAAGYGAPMNGKGRTDGAAKPHQVQPSPRAPSEWGPVVPLNDGGAPVERFPLEVYPEWLRDTCARIAAAVPCPVDYPATFALGIAAGTVGSTLALKIKGKWIERPVLYVCVVARPNDGKSPALDPLMEPVVDEHARRVRAGEADKEPAYVSDVTVESLATILQTSPRGLLLARDELSGWVGSMDQYKAKGSGADRQFWLQNWTGTSINVRRKDKDRPAIFVRHPAVTLVGGMQPAVINSLRGQDDGFFDRILFSYQAPLPAAEENWDAVDEADLADWALRLEQLRDRKLTANEKGDRPWLVHMDEGARAEWEEFSRWRAGRLNDPDLNESLRGPVGKLSNYAPRLALIVYALRTAHTQTERLPALSGPDMKAGTALAKYFESHGAKVFRVAGRDARIGLAKKLLGWMERNGVRSFDRRDAHRAVFGSVDKPDDVIAPLKLLDESGYIRPAEQEQWVGAGRRPAPSYEVNPAVHQKRADKPDR